MSRQARFQPHLQRLVLLAYQSIGYGDVSASEALTAAAVNDGAVSDKLLQAWRAGGEHVSEMPIGALDALLQHAGDKAGRILGAICRRYGYEAIPVAGKAQVSHAECIERLRGVATAEVGDLHRLGPSDDPERIAKEWNEALEVVKAGAALAEQRAMAARGVALPLRVAGGS